MRTEKYFKEFPTWGKVIAWGVIGGGVAVALLYALTRGVSAVTQLVEAVTGLIF